MKILSFLPMSAFSLIGIFSPILDWIFKDKSLQEINVENSLNEVEDEYKKALKDIRNNIKNEVTINLKNGDKLVVKSLK